MLVVRFWRNVHLADRPLGCAPADLRLQRDEIDEVVGVTPEVVHPFAAAVTTAPTRDSTLRFVPLDALLDQPHWLRDGHLRVVAYRATHALGSLQGYSG